MKSRVNLSAAEARRVAMAAQGFARQRPASATDVRHFRRALDAITVLQLDFVNVLMPAHFLMIWSRLGAYDRARFERYLYRSGEFTEQWAHEASVVSTADWPLLAERRRCFVQWKNSPLNQMNDRDRYLDEILTHVREHGATASNELPAVAGPKRKKGDWHRSIPRWGLEHHFGSGELAVWQRRKNFQREYDLPERLIDERHRTACVSPVDANRMLVQKACVALGVATLHDIADYYRMRTGDVAPRLAELVDAGRLRPVTVNGWEQQAYLSSTARLPREIPGASLLSPFDPLVWFRPRAKRLFGFDYRIEIYVPAAQRRWGYYVLPFRVGDRIAARVDLKADRKASVLKVQRAHLEPGANDAETALALRTELQLLADWLCLETIEVAGNSRFEKNLARR